MQKNKMRKLLAIILVLGSLGYIYYNFYLRQQIADISKIKTSIEAKNSNIKMLNDRKGKIDREIEDSKISQSLEKAIPDTFNIKEDIIYLYELAKKAGVVGDKITYSEIKNRKDISGFKAYSGNFKIEGEYGAVKSFIKSVEDSEKKYVVKQINIGKADGNNYNVTMTVELYSIK